MNTSLISWDNFLPIFATLLSIVFVLCKCKRIKKKFPPGPIGLPVLGYLPFLGKEPYCVLNELSKKFGNVFSLYLGQTYVVLLGDYDAVKDAFSKSTTVDRPENIFDFIPSGVGFSSVNGEEWVEQRRYCVRSMRNLGLGKGPWETILLEEVEEFLKTVDSYRGEPVDIDHDLLSSVSNNITSLVLGRRLPVGSPVRNFVNYSIDNLSRTAAQAGVRIYFPRIWNILLKLGIGGACKRQESVLEFEDYIQKEISVRKNSIAGHSGNQDNFIEGYISEMKSKRSGNEITYFNDTNLCGNITALIVGGSDTTRTSLIWLLIAMASYPEVQQKVRAELDEVLGSHHVETWEEKTRVPYTYATIMEGQRWRTVAPLNTSRIAQEDITICGYDIPKGATIIANNWGLHNDTRYWKKPEVFMPERFFQNNCTEVIQRPQSYVPFSYGKRNCPGETVAMMEILVYFSALMKNFEVKFSDSVPMPKIKVILGLTYQAVGTKLRFLARNQ